MILTDRPACPRLGNMKQRKITSCNTKVWIDVGPEMLSVIDAERQRFGACSRAAIVRMALLQWVEKKESAKTEGQVA